MSDWADDVIKSRQESELDKQWRQQKSAALASKIGSLFSDLEERSKGGIRKLQGSGMAVEQGEDYPGCFTVRNLVYPTATVTIRVGVGCITFKTTTRLNAEAKMESAEDRIDISLDEEWNPVLFHKGVRLDGVDEAIKLMLKPAVDK